jgi:macrodomain Ter protein organizer (MatP/YcbG family)
MERAKERFRQAHLAETLRAQIAAAQEAQRIRDYLAALESEHGQSADAAEWISWIRLSGLSARCKLAFSASLLAYSPILTIEESLMPRVGQRRERHVSCTQHSTHDSP